MTREMTTGGIGIKGLFLNYGGTLAPVRIPRNYSRVPRETELALWELRERIPVGIITTQSLEFVVPRTQFAHAWYAVGIEMRVGERLYPPLFTPEALPLVARALEFARTRLARGMFIEEKRAMSGSVAAFCVDWRYASDQERAGIAVSEIADFCRALRLCVIPSGQPYCNVYAHDIDITRALPAMKRELGVTAGVMYLGDSEADNPVFAAVEVAIGVVHEESGEALGCHSKIRFEEAAVFFRRLLANNLVFEPELAVFGPEPVR
ncbi:MAG: hypothetical protein HYX96_06520 [Chloroflexi bacterium]|nr:hypothetical protein [Chloroflexota bacterium]